MTIKLITAPTELPVSLETAKEHLRVYHDEDDDLIEHYIAAATQIAEENYLNRALCEQTLELILDRWPAREIRLRPPVQSVTSVKYMDNKGTLHTIDPDDYIVDTESTPGRILPVDAWPADCLYLFSAVRVRFVTGTDAADVPTDIKQAILVMAGDYYANREEVVVGTSVLRIPGLAHTMLSAYGRTGADF